MSQETKIATYLASEIHQEHRDCHRYELDEVTKFVYFKFKELYRTAARLSGFAHWRDSSKSSAKRRSDNARYAVTKDAAIRAMSPGPEPRVLIDVTPTHRFGKRGGIERVVREIARNAIETGSALPVIIENGRLKSYFRHPAIPKTIKIAAGDKFLMLDASWSLVDEYLPIMQQISRMNGENIVALHDIIPLLYPTLAEQEEFIAFRRWFDSVVLASDAVVCISKSTSDAFMDYIARNDCDQNPNQRIGWWKLGADFEIDAHAQVSAQTLEVASDRSPYFLSVGTLEPRKGYSVALSAFEKLWSYDVDVRYVIVGRPGRQTRALERRICEHPEYGRRLFWLDDANDAELDHLYRRAHGLMAASFAEGLGLPLVEAARLRLTVIASDIPPFREVGGEAIRYFDVLDSESLACCILGALVSPHAVGAPSTCSWSDSTQRLLNLIRRGDYQWRPKRQESFDWTRPRPQQETADVQGLAPLLVYNERGHFAVDFRGDSTRRIGVAASAL
jgi:glycosyltransferase involved in cell wall biosynthesis